MCKIVINQIPKTTDNIIKKVEKELQGVSDIYVDKKINRKIEREISHLGKERLLVDHIYNLSKKFDKKNKNKVLFLLVKLYNFNKQIHESLSKELMNDKKILNNRIKTKIDKNKVHKDLYNKLLKIADKHYKVVKDYAKTFNPRKKYSTSFINNIVYHKRQAERIYKTLTNVSMRKTLHKVLLVKLDKVYQELINFTIKLAKIISISIKDINNNKINNFRKKSKEMQQIVSNKIEVLGSFAYKYTYNIIHSNHFFDFDKNRIILIKKRT